MKPRKYQIYSHAIILADGFILATSKKDAEEKWKKFVRDEMVGLSFGECKVTEVIPETGRNFDHDGAPEREELEDGPTTMSFLN